MSFYHKRDQYKVVLTGCHMLPILWLVPLGATFANADCCHSFNVGNRLNPFTTINICLDGLEISTLYCGIGPCNVFGCNCDGGCRHANSSTCYDNCVRLMESSDNNCESVCSLNKEIVAIPITTIRDATEWVSAIEVHVDKCFLSGFLPKLPYYGVQSVSTKCMITM